MQRSKAITCDSKSITEQGVLSGILNHFDNKDYAGDITQKGAFTVSLKQITDSGRDLVLLWQHDQTQPIGVWKNLRETARGLEGEAHLNLDVAQGKEAYALAKQGALSGFSIGYYVVNESYDAKTKANLLHEVSLLETSLVTFPCNDLSRTEEVKMKLKNNVLPTVDELKSFLQTQGVSESDTNMICAKYLPEYIDPEEALRLRAEAKQAAQEQVTAMIAEFGLMGQKAEASKDEDEDEDEDAADAKGGKESDEDKDESQEEKSGSMDAFFK